MTVSVKFKFWFYANYWWVVGLALMLSLTYFWAEGTPSQVAIPAVATLLSLIYFLQKQKIEELRLFREIFAECNSRYDEMNENLNKIINCTTENLADAEKEVLINYFNLCGEEYLYYKHGYIYPDVWRAWSNGIRFYLNDDRIKTFWICELESNSYYGVPKDL